MPELTDLSPQQKAIIELPLTPFSVTACAGAGKTKTAVHRLAAMRRLCKDRHATVALLSFSNVAVDTFQMEYGRLNGVTTTSPAGVEIDTLDSFFTRNILRPHGHLAMKCKRAPFLVEGTEPFLKHFTVWDGAQSILATDVTITIAKGDWLFKAGRWVKAELPKAAAAAGIAKLGEIGAYHHDAGRYWTLRLLRENPFLLRALVRRYPHILIDEAQDIEPVHEALLSSMISAGSQVSLIGDVNQGIFEFSGATGEFLDGYGKRPGVTLKTLERNYRSVPSIVEIANKLSGRNDTADRTVPEALCGAFFLAMDDNHDAALKTFSNLLDQAKLSPSAGVVLCRSSAVADQWAGGSKNRGQAAIKAFALAAIARDKLKRLDTAFSYVSAAVVRLLHPDNHDLLSKIKRAQTQDTKALRRVLWRFTRDSLTGVPLADLVADTAWHSALVPRVKALVTSLEKDHGLKAADNLGKRLAKTGLANAPLIDPSNAPEGKRPYRISTVHKAKGESISGVFYAARKSDILALLSGPATEEGRIGYVAVTRARDLFVLGVPVKCLEELKPALIAAGFAPLPL